jgi:hypothetical protein
MMSGQEEKRKEKDAIQLTHHGDKLAEDVLPKHIGRVKHRHSLVVIHQIDLLKESKPAEVGSIWEMRSRACNVTA